MTTQSGLMVDIKLQSLTDVITNSSTCIYTMYNIRDKDTIKNLVNAILAIEGKYTFNDLFEIGFTVNSWILKDIYDRDESLQEKYSTFEAFEDYISTLSDEELVAWDDVAKDSTYDPICLFEGFWVSVKKDVTETEVLKKAAQAIQTIDNIFTYEATFG